MRGWRVAAVAAALPVAAAWQWTAVAPVNTPPARFGAATAFFQASGSAGSPLICGGEGSSGVLDDCYLLAVDGWVFNSVVGTNVLPPRAMHTAALTLPPDYCLLWGGNTTSLDPDVVQTGQWSSQAALFFNAPNVTRYGHSAAVVPEVPGWVIFGGAAVDTDAELADLLSLSLGASGRDGGIPAFTWTAMQQLGTLPGPRKFHTAVMYTNDQMVVYGGVQGGVALNDAYLLILSEPLDSGTWQALPMVAPAPALYGHRALMVGSLMVVVGGLTAGGAATPAAPSGGVYALDVAAGTWSTPAVAGTPPAAWFLGTAAAFTPAGAAQPQVMYFGGATTDVGGVPSAALFVLSAIGVEPEPDNTRTWVIAGATTGTGLVLLFAGLAWWNRRMLCGKRPARAATSGGGYETLPNAAAPGVPVGTYSYAYSFATPTPGGSQLGTTPGGAADGVAAYTPYDAASAYGDETDEEAETRVRFR